MAQYTLAYLRHSSEGQKVPGQTVEAQLAQLEAHGFDELFRDTQSGRDEDRPEFLKLIERAKELIRDGDEVTILFARYDRWARNAGYSLPLVEELELLGVKLHSVERGPVSVATSADFMITSQEAVIAEYLSRQISDNVAKGKRYKRDMGRPLGWPPIGYKMNEDKTQYIPDPETAGFIQKWFQLYADGMSLYKLTLIVKEDGFPRSRQAIHYMLKNPVYRGCLRFSEGGDSRKKRSLKIRPKKTIVTNCHEPIVQDDLWFRVQGKLKDNRKLWGVNTGLGQYLFKGQVYCEDCGWACVTRLRSWTRRSDQQHFRIRTFWCQNELCSSRHGGIKESDLEAQVQAVIQSRAEALGELISQSSPETPMNPQILAKQRDLEELRALNDRLHQTHLEAAIAQLEREIADLQGEDQRSVEERVNQKELIEAVRQRDFWVAMDYSNRSGLYRELVSRVILNSQTKTVHEVKLRF